MFEHSGSSEHVENVGTGIKDPLSELVSRVHPLPESMTDHLFGALCKIVKRAAARGVLCFTRNDSLYYYRH